MSFRPLAPSWEPVPTTGEKVGEPVDDYMGSVNAVATAVFDGRPVAVTGSDDEKVRVWDLTTGQQRSRELVFSAPVNAETVSSDGRLLVGFGWDAAVLARR